MERDVRAARGEPPIRVEHLGRVGVLERDHEPIEAVLFHQIAVIGGRLDDRGELVARVLIEKGGRYRSTIYPDPDREIVVARDIAEPADLRGKRLGLFDIMQVARVIANLIDEGRDLACYFVVFLEID